MVWCKEDASVREVKNSIRLNVDMKDIKISVSAFVLSVTPYGKAKKVWSDGKVIRNEFAENKLLFIESDKDYLTKVFRNLKEEK